MRSRYDAEAHALYLRFVNAPVVESEEIRPDLVLDFDARGRIVAVEILDASVLAPGSGIARPTREGDAGGAVRSPSRISGR